MLTMRLCVEDPNDLQQLTRSIIDEGDALGLKLDTSKTKVLVS